MTLTFDHEKTEVLINDPDDAVFADQWDEGGEKVIAFHFDTGREWEPEETEDGGVMVRTKPNPDVVVYDEGITRIVAVQAGTLVFKAFRTAEDVDTFLLKLVDSIEEDYEGIESVDAEAYDEEFNELVREVHDRVEEFTQ